MQVLGPQSCNRFSSAPFRSARRTTSNHVARASTGSSSQAAHEDAEHQPVLTIPRRLLLSLPALLAAVSSTQASPAQAYAGLDYKQEMARRRKKIPIEDFEDGPSGIKLYDIIKGTGAEAAVGQRVAVHYDVKFRNITFITSRMGMGVTGGTPVGFNIGVEEGSAGSILPGIDLGIRGMRVGGLRRLIVPPELAYGERGIGEIPPNTTLTIDLELLSIKTSPLGFRTKLVEG